MVGGGVFGPEPEGHADCAEGVGVLFEGGGGGAWGDGLEVDGGECFPGELFGVWWRWGCVGGGEPDEAAHVLVWEVGAFWSGAALDGAVLVAVPDGVSCWWLGLDGFAPFLTVWDPGAEIRGARHCDTVESASRLAARLGRFPIRSPRINRTLMTTMAFDRTSADRRAAFDVDVCPRRRGN